MILTGMLIYVPSAERAGVAALVCVVALCNLNFFRPHKNKMLFWLSQLAFILSTIKYVTALVLTVAELEGANAVDVDAVQDAHARVDGIGVFLIFLDISFLTAAVCLILVSVKSVKREAAHGKGVSSATWQNQDENKNNNDKRGIVRRRSPSVQVAPTPSSSAPSSSAPAEDDDEHHDEPHVVQRRVTSLMESHHKHEQRLHRVHSERQYQSTRKTQARIHARLMVKRSRVLSKVPLFSNVPDDGIAAILDVTKFERFEAGEVLCRQGAEADTFYILISGRAAVSVTQPAPPEMGGESVAGGLLEFRVGILKELDVLGEGCLLFDGERVRNATVTAVQTTEALSLHREELTRLMAEGVLDSMVLYSMRHVRETRASTTVAIVAAQSSPAALVQGAAEEGEQGTSTSVGELKAPPLVGAPGLQLPSIAVPADSGAAGGGGVVLL